MTAHITFTKTHLEQLQLAYGKAMVKDEHYITWGIHDLSTDFTKELIKFLAKELEEEE